MTALVCPVVRQSHAWCRPRPRIRHDERWIGELMRYSHLTKGTISTTLCRYMATFVRLLASKPPIQEMRLEKPPLLRRQRTDPSKPNSQSGVLWVHGGHDAVCIQRGGFSRFWPFLARNAHETAKNGHIGRFTYTTHRCHSTTMPRSSPLNSVGRGMANRPELRAWSE